MGSLTRKAAAGDNRIALPTALARRLRARGPFRLVVVATDAAGNRANPVRKPVQR